MGVERSVTRWYIQHHMILQEIALVEAQLAQAATVSAEENNGVASPAVPDVPLQLKKAQERLHLLGPCPRPMMG